MSTRLIHALVKDLLALWDFYTKKKLVKDKAEVYDESILWKDNNAYKANKSYLCKNDSNGKILNDNTFEQEEEDEKKNSVSPFRRATVHNYLEEDLSLIERTAQRVKPIIEALKTFLVVEKKIDDIDSIDQDIPSERNRSHELRENPDVSNEERGGKKTSKKIEPDMRIVLGYLNQLEMISNLNIGNIMQIQPVRIEDLLSVPRNETEFNRTSFIDKISLLWVTYFCISTEIRFIIQLKEDSNYDEKEKGEESEYWHAKSLEIAWTFLPSDWPLLNHILLSYQKHHSPCQQTIQEDGVNEQNLHIVKPLKGIESSKFRPIIRRLDADKIVLTPPTFSPADTITNKMILSYQSFLTYGSHSLYQQNNKSNILDYSSNKDKSRNTGTTRHRSVSNNRVAEDESFRSMNSKSAMPEIQEKENNLQQNSVTSGNSFSKKNSVGNPSEHKIIDKLLNFIMKDKNLEDKDKVLEALMSDDLDIEDTFVRRNSSKKKRDKDSLLMDSVLQNHHSTSYKEIQPDDSMGIGMLSNDISKVNMTEDMGNAKFLFNDKKKAKEKRLLNKLIDRGSSSHKKVRPKSSKGIRSNHTKVNTMNNFETQKSKSRKINQWMSSNIHGTRMKNRQGGKKKNNMLGNIPKVVINLGMRPSSSKDARNIKSINK